VGAGVTLYRKEVKKDADGNPVSDGKGGFLMDEGPQTFLLKRLAVSHDRRGAKYTLEENALVPENEGIRILIKDTIRPVRGYTDGGSDLIVAIRTGFSVEQVKKELNRYLADAKLDGIPVLQMSEMDYTPVEERAPSSTVNQKHKERCFKLIRCGGAPFSDNWEIVDRHPDQDDVFVIINRFIPVDVSYSWFDRVNNDKKAMKRLFNEELPDIFGIKDTCKHPVKAADVEGIPFDKWREEAFQEALGQHPDILAYIEAMEWTGLTLGKFPWNSGNESGAYRYLKANLDGRHRILRLFKSREEARALMGQMPKDKQESIKHLVITLGLRRKESPAIRAFQRVAEKYPLLQLNDHGNTLGLGVFSVSEIQDRWLTYIHLIDNCTNKEK
jgi:hypothetical protein